MKRNTSRVTFELKPVCRNSEQSIREQIVTSLNYTIPKSSEFQPHLSVLFIQHHKLYVNVVHMHLSYAASSIH